MKTKKCLPLNKLATIEQIVDHFEIEKEKLLEWKDKQKLDFIYSEGVAYCLPKKVDSLIAVTCDPTHKVCAELSVEHFQVQTLINNKKIPGIYRRGETGRYRMFDDIGKQYIKDELKKRELDRTPVGGGVKTVKASNYGTRMADMSRAVKDLREMVLELSGEVQELKKQRMVG
jgi:hypothetical protein